MKGKTTRRLLSVICFLVLFALLFQKVEWVLSLKKGSSRVHNFYQEEKNSLDVIFLGSSHAYYGIHPMDFWRDYGVPSYVLGSPLQNTGTSYYLLKDALKRQKPKVVVMEGYTLFAEQKISNDGMFQQTMDGMPYSLNKIQMGEELLRDTKDFSERLPYHIPIIQYHSRWKNLESKDFTGAESCYKGGKPIFGGNAYQKPKKVTGEREIPEVSWQYVEKIIELCQEEGVELMFCVMPFSSDAKNYVKRQKIYNKLASELESRQIPCINYADLIDELGVDYSTDFRDEGHMNVNGATKVDAHLFSYLVEHYDLTDKREDEEYASWHEDRKQYDLKLEELRLEAEQGGGGSNDDLGDQDE